MTKHLIWGGLCIDGIINLLHYFGVSVVCTIFLIEYSSSSILIWTS